MAPRTKLSTTNIKYNINVFCPFQLSLIATKIARSGHRGRWCRRCDNLMWYVSLVFNDAGTNGLLNDLWPSSNFGRLCVVIFPDPFEPPSFVHH